MGAGTPVDYFVVPDGKWLAYGLDGKGGAHLVYNVGTGQPVITMALFRASKPVFDKPAIILYFVTREFYRSAI
jgi:hypothetical protein